VGRGDGRVGDNLAGVVAHEAGDAGGNDALRERKWRQR